MLIEFLKRFTYSLFPPGTIIREKYEAFKRILNNNLLAHNVLAEFEDYFYNKKRIEFSYIKAKYEELYIAINEMIKDLSILSPKYVNLSDYLKKIDFYIRMHFIDEDYNFSPPFVLTTFDINEDNIKLIGTKAKNLFLLKKNSFNIPNFFVITHNAYFYFYEYNNLKARIEELLAKLDDIYNIESINNISQKIKHLILESEVPKIIIDDIYNSYKKLWKQEDVRLILRSSALLEDTNISFAGQYLSKPNVSLNTLPNVYKEIIASKYTPNAIFYRIFYGYKDIQLPMAVIVQELIPHKIGGVIYTNLEDNLILEFSDGSIENIVSGSTIPNKIKISRKDLDLKVIDKYNLSDKLVEIVKNSLKIENLFNSPQDIEWCIDNNDNIFILQSRPFNKEHNNSLLLDQAINQIQDQDILIKDKGIVASHGLSSGKLFILLNDNLLNQIPEDSILVTKYAKPEYALILTRIKGIITEYGSTTGHLASVAREFNIPMLTAVENATIILNDFSHQNVTLWAEKKLLMKGIHNTNFTDNKNNKIEHIYTNSPVYTKLKDITKLISPLRLLDPESDEFIVENCKTLHDIIRFIHEKTISSIFKIGTSFNEHKSAKKFKINDAISFYVLDLGGGLNNAVINKAEINLIDITSEHFTSLIKGLIDTFNNQEKKHLFDWKTFSELVEGGGITSKNSTNFSSYALISSDYMNIHIRFGYHFAIIDSIASENIDHNYISFRFSGGGGTLDGRILRAKFIAHILKSLNFTTNIKGDTVNATLKKLIKKDIIKKIFTIGQLLGFTTQLDLKLKNNIDFEKSLNEFYNKTKLTFNNHIINNL